MRVWDRMRTLFGRARAGAGEVAHAASLRLAVRDLEGRRDHLFRSIGRRVLVLHEEGRGIPEFAALCEQLREVERGIDEKRAEIGSKRADRKQQTAAGAGA